MRTRRRPAWSVRLHAGLVGALLALFTALWLSAPPWEGGGANIGAGLAGLPLLGLGLPWTYPYLAATYAFDDLSDVLWYLVVLGPAPLNVALHALAVRWWRRSRTPTAGDRPDT